MTDKPSIALAAAASAPWQDNIQQGVEARVASLNPGQKTSVELNRGLADETRREIPVTIVVHGKGNENRRTEWARDIGDGLIKWGDDTFTLVK